MHMIELSGETNLMLYETM